MVDLTPQYPLCKESNLVSKIDTTDMSISTKNIINKLIELCPDYKIYACNNPNGIFCENYLGMNIKKLCHIKKE